MEGKNKIYGPTSDLVSRRRASMALCLHQAQLPGLEFHNVPINGIRSEHTQAIGVLLIDDLASVEHTDDLLGLLRGFFDHLVLHSDDIVGLNVTKEVAAEVDTIIKASGRELGGLLKRRTCSRVRPCSTLCRIRQSPG